ncbi:MAG: septum formation initiator family protein [Clostridiales bacterium]|nr:septum formation initiator family protein [Clostridiales bacterium]
MQKKRRKKKSKIFTIVLIIIGLYAFFALARQQREINHLRTQKTNYEEKIQQAKQEIVSIENSLKNATSNENIEKMAREKLRMIHADEIIFIDIGKTED